MKIGTVYRASSQKDKQDPSILEIDGCPNFYYHTFMQGKSKILFQRGVHSIARVSLKDGTSRVPAIILSSSPHKHYVFKMMPSKDLHDRRLF